MLIGVLVTGFVLNVAGTCAFYGKKGKMRDMCNNIVIFDVL